MKYKRVALRLTMMSVLACSTVTATAGLLEKMKTGFGNVVEALTPYRGPQKDITTLIITSNYIKSKMLAELIQIETKQPYILLPAAGQENIFFVPAHGRNPQRIPYDKLSRFIKFVNPKQVIVLGDKSYVPENYVNMIDEHQTLWAVSNKNWFETSKSVGSLLDLSNLASDFRRTLYDWEGGQRYVPAKSQIPLQQIETFETVEIPEEQVLETEFAVAPEFEEFLSIEEKQEEFVAEELSIETLPLTDITDIENFDEPEIVFPDEAPIIVE